MGHQRAARFSFVGHDLDLGADRTTLACHYELDDVAFTETFGFDAAAPGVDPAAVDAAARLVHLLAGVSYYKAGAPPLIEVPGGLTPAERALLAATHLDGLGEFAFENDLDLADVVIEAPERAPLDPSTDAPEPGPGRPLIPFGGGLDSIVTVEGLRDRAPDAALFVVSRGGDRFAAIETAAAVADLPVVRAERTLDPQILRSRELGWLNGHIPVTGIISAVAVTAAVLAGRDSVVMSNEWSASMGNVERDGRMVNHQWSKSLEFEDLFRAALGEALPTPVAYYSWLRPFSEVWVAERFSHHPGYHRAFRSCNRAFHIDPARRLDHWCGRCDKCAFIDLILSPFLPEAELAAIFDGAEPLAAPDLADQLRALLGLTDVKPFECVGDVDECRVAILAAAARPDRADAALVQDLAAEVRAVDPIDLDAGLARMLAPMGPHRIPNAHAPSAVLG